jgi:hypothetical protein
MEDVGISGTQFWHDLRPRVICILFAQNLHCPEFRVIRGFRERVRFRLAQTASEFRRLVQGQSAPIPERLLEIGDLEQRVLLSANPVAAISAELAFAPAPTVDAAIIGEAAATGPAASSGEADSGDVQKSESLLGSSLEDSSQTIREFVFIDESAFDSDQLIADLEDQIASGRAIGFAVLDGSRDGVEQISEVLASLSENDLDAIHIVSHGTDGAVRLGSTWLQASSLSGHAGAIATWGGVLGTDGDILIYGCDLASNSGGELLVESIAALTGADVAASTDDTGSALLGGDWELEYKSGSIESNVIFTEQLQAEWNGLLTVLYAHESFDYAAGSLEGQNGGVGWATAWDTTSGSSALVNATGLSDPTTLLSVSGGTAEMSTSSIFTQNRDLTTTLGTDGTTAWFSFLVKPDGVSFGGISLEIGDGAGAKDTVTVGTNDNDFLITRNGSTTGAASIDDVLVDAQTYFLAVQIDFAAGADTVTLYVDPTPGLGAPNSLPASTVQLSTADLGMFTQVGMIGGFSGNNSNLDEIRVGDSFADVAPTGAPNMPPTANAGGPYVIKEGDALALDGSASDDPDMDSLSFRWDLDNDGNYGEAGEPTTETPSVSWATLQTFGIDDDSGGPYTIGLQVDDGKGGVATATTTVTVNNTAPVLSTTGSGTVSAGSSYTLNLSATDPGADTISSWTINWGDGAIETFAGNPASVAHTYTAAGFTFNILASAIDEDGTYFQNELIVASSNTDSIFRYGTDGEFLQEFGILPDAETPDYPVDTIIGPDGNLYVSGWISSNVLRYDATTGAFIDEFVTAGNNGLDSAAGIAFGPDGHLYVASRLTSEVLRFDGSTGDFIDAFVMAGSSDLDEAEGLVFGPDGDLYVSDYANSAVYKYDGTTGVFDSNFVTAGSGTLDKAEDLTFGPDGNLYVADDNGSSVLRYDGTTGAFIDDFIPSGSDGLTFATGVGFGPDGNLYVSSWGTHNVLMFDGTTGVFIDEYVMAGSSGLTEPDYFTFIPEHQVSVTAALPLVVDTTDDVVDGDTSSVMALVGNKGMDGFISLREAIIATNMDLGADTISLSAGIYELTLTGTNEDAAASGDLDILDELTITGAGSTLSIVDGLGLDKVFETRGGPTVTIEDLTVQGGNAANKWGGGINMENGGTVVLNRLLIRSNNGASGGGIYNYQGNLTVIDTTLAENTGSYGAGIYNDGGIAVLNRVTISENHASNDGGGVYAFGAGANTTLTNVTISGNTADARGGGYATSKINSLTNVTIAYNTAPIAGGIFISNPGSIDLKNSIVAFNTGGNANTTVNSLGNNIDSENTLGLAGAGDQINTDPLLAPLNSNGGITQTHALLSLGGAQQSPAINNGTIVNAPAEDQRGEARDASPDVGAYEVVLGSNAPPSITLSTSVVNYFVSTPAKPIDPAVTVLDPDSPNFDTGVLIVDFAAATGTVNDRLAIRDEGTATGQIGVSSGNVTFGGIVIGSFTGGTDGTTPLVITLNAVADQAATQALLRNVTYENVSVAPTSAPRTIRFTLTDGDGGTSNSATTSLQIVDDSSHGLLLSTFANSANGGAGLGSWTSGEVLELTDPNLTFESVSNTDGTLSSLLNHGSLVVDGSANVDAIHYVSRDITVGGGGGSLNLLTGDILLSLASTEDLSSTNTLTVENSDVFRFRPDTAGDYSAGTFQMVLDDPIGGTTNVVGISLIEQSTTVGDKLLDAGDFLFSRAGATEANDIYLFETTDVGETTTSGTIVQLIEGDDVGITSQIAGLELIESGTSIGDAVLGTGTILFTLNGSDTIGSTSTAVVRQDVVTLNVTQTAAVAGTAIAEATIFVEGADLSLTTNNESADALSLGPESGPPVASDDAYALDQGAALNEPAISGVLTNDTDPDVDPLTATLVSGPAFASSFMLNSDGSFDYTHDGSETISDSFTYAASDGTGSTNATVTLTIAPVNDNAPVIDAAQNFAIAEDIPNFTVVGTVTATDVDPGSTFGNWMIVGGDPAAVFAINSATGQITIADNSTLDFDTSPTSYALSVTTSDGTNSSAPETVTVNLTDVNDIAPVIDPAQSFNIPENIANLAVVDTVAASDADTTGEPRQNWMIVGGDPTGVFAINSATGQITIADNSTLDFDTSPTSYALSVTTSDGTNSSAPETVTVNLTDVNDIAPVIDPAQSFDIPEDIANSAVVGTVAANDVDTTGEPRQNWMIVGGDPAGVFAINSATGQITIADNSTLDFDTSPTSYALSVTTSDGTNTSAPETVTVNLADVNDIAPVIDPAQSFDIPEDIANSAVVGTVAASDADTTGEPRQNWLIVGGDPADAFTINASSGQITIADSSTLDFDSAPTNYALSITTSDGMNTSAAETVTINLTDVNDTAPEIDPGQSFNIAEDIANLAVVGTVTATDRDAGTTLSNWQITDGDPADVFAIDASSGQITIADNSTLDFDSAPTGYALSITTSDGTNTSAAETVTINLTDVNDTAPVVDPGQSFNIAEGIANLALVGTVAATDGDAGTTFSDWTIVFGNTAGVFRLDAVTGELSVADNTNLDFETSTGYTLDITVSDGNNTSAIEAVLIAVTDQNDELPIVTPGQSFNLAETSAFGTPLGTVTATNADAGTTLSGWTIVSGNADGIFAINGATGELTVADNTNLDFETSTGYSLGVSVSDGVNTSAIEAVEIAVSDQNDEPPVIAPGQTFSVSETTASGTLLGTVIATDGDAGAVLSDWVIVSGNAAGIFAIDNATGVLTVADDSNLDFELTSIHVLGLRVSDGTNASAAQTATVSVTNVNETPTANGDAYSLNEGATLTTTAASGVLANDSDTDGDTLTVTLVIGPVRAASFSLNADGSFAYQHGGSETTADSFTYAISDGALTVQATALLTVSPRNDAPVAVADVYTINGNTSLTVAADLGVLANDSDVDGPALTTQLVVGPAVGSLTLNANGGFNFVPPVAFSGSVTFTYLATDGLLTSGPATVTISVSAAAVAPTPASSLVDADASESSSEFEAETSESESLDAESTEVVDLVDTDGPTTDVDRPAESVAEDTMTLETVAPVATEAPLSEAPPETVPTGTSTEDAGPNGGATVGGPATSASKATSQDADQRDLDESDSTRRSATTSTDGFRTQRISREQLAQSLRFRSEDLSFVVQDNYMTQVKSIDDELQFETQVPEWAVGSAVVTTTSLSVGYIVWMVRGGYVLASVLSTMPVWQNIDPLPVLDALDGVDDDDESLESMIDAVEEDGIAAEAQAASTTDESSGAA